MTTYYLTGPPLNFIISIIANFINAVQCGIKIISPDLLIFIRLMKVIFMLFAAIGSKIKTELIRAWSLTFYFAIFFIAISYFRFAVLQHAEVPYTDFYLGVIKAAVCAKFLLISQALYPLKVHDGKPLIGHILSRSVLYVLIVIILVAIEEYIVAKIHGTLPEHAITGLEAGTLNLFFSLTILYWLMVIPYVMYSAIDKYIGEQKLTTILFKTHK